MPGDRLEGQSRRLRLPYCSNESDPLWSAVFCSRLPKGNTSSLESRVPL
jgi:hypothetical protein